MMMILKWSSDCLHKTRAVPTKTLATTKLLQLQLLELKVSPLYFKKIAATTGRSSARIRLGLVCQHQQSHPFRQWETSKSFLSWVLRERMLRPASPGSLPTWTLKQWSRGQLILISKESLRVFPRICLVFHHFGAPCHSQTFGGLHWGSKRFFQAGKTADCPLPGPKGPAQT